MYAWIWRHLPGDRRAKWLGAVLLLLIVLAVLFFVVFPYVEPRLALNNVTVDPAGTNPG